VSELEQLRLFELPEPAPVVPRCACVTGVLPALDGERYVIRAGRPADFDGDDWYYAGHDRDGFDVWTPTPGDAVWYDDDFEAGSTARHFCGAEVVNVGAVL